MGEGIGHLNRCYQCCACSDACPMAFTMDFYPHQLIHMVRLGLKEKVLQSKAIWVCVSCWTCATRCPNEIDIVRLMDVLRRESLKEGLKGPMDKVPQFHKVFLGEVERRGRISEIRLLFRYKIKAGGFFPLRKFYEDASLALKMFLKGRLKLSSPMISAQQDMEGIFKRLHGSKAKQ